VLNIIVTQVLNSTTAQVNLLDKNGKPSETDVAMTFYDQTSGKQKYNYIHTMNNRGVPDTLRPDAATTYHLVVHTLPKVERKDIKLTPGKHNTIALDAPQGFLKVQAGNGSFHRDIKCIIRQAKSTQTLDVMETREQRKLITGKYDLEILTLPRTYVSGVEISQSHTTTVSIDEPGMVNFQLSTPGITSILKEDKGITEWVCNLSDAQLQETIKLQPGSYKAVFRAKGVKETLFSSQTAFQVQAGTSQKVIIR
jgi:Ca-activated chloride channel family protein